MTEKNFIRGSASILGAVLILALTLGVYSQSAAAASAQCAPPAPAMVAPMLVDCLSPGAPIETQSVLQPIPVAGQDCPQWVHDRIVTTGPDGNSYPTWHPPIDPEFGCMFGHEHGADPRTSRANSDLPAFGYAAQQMGMTEPHVGFKVFVMNAGDTVESNVPNKIADEDVRLVFHQGTSGTKRFTEQFHSMQLDYVDRAGSGRFAHLYGMTDTGPASQDGSTCDTPRLGAKDFSSVNCLDTYEIWNSTRFQISDPHDPFKGINESRFGAVPSVATFDPITTRNTSDSSQLVFTQDVKPVNGITSPAPKLPSAPYQGCRREFYAGPLYWNNLAGPTVFWTDPMGVVSSSNQPDAQHTIRQELSATTGSKGVIFKDRQDFCGNGIHFPN